MPRCNHDPLPLYDDPPKGNIALALDYTFANGRHRWVICRNCGATGYWGGYGIHRRVRWGYGGDAEQLQRAENYNRSVAREVALQSAE